MELRHPRARQTPAGRVWERLGQLAGAVDLPLLLIVAAATTFVGSYTRRVTDWIVMTDELLYAKLSLSIAESLSPLPRLHGETIALSSQLYPLLTAPFYAAFDFPTAFHVVHLVNAALMASAALPAYLLAREVLSSRPGAYAAAALSVAIPWLLLSSYGLTEVAAYPAFVWAMLAIQRATVLPALHRDVLAVAAIAVAVLARTQFFALALVLPATILLHEVGYRAAIANRRRAAAREGAKAALASHRPLAAVCGVLAVLAVPLALTGRLNDVLGPYAITATEGSLLPDGVWSSAAKHVAAVAIAVGALPFLLALGWAVAAALRPTERRTHAFALLLVVTVCLLAVQVGSFAVRFGAGATRDRYLFYVAPLLFIGMLACLLDVRRRWAGVLVGTALFVALARQADLEPPPGFWEFHAVDRPASVLNGSLADLAAELDLGARTLVAAIGLVLGLVVAGCLARLPRRPVTVVVAGTVLLFCALETRHAFERLEGGLSPSGRSLAGPGLEGRDWIDDAVADGTRAGLVPYPIASTWGPSAVAWWDAEFWNRTAQRAYVVAEESFSYTPPTFPQGRLGLDFQSGRLEVEGDGEPAYLVLAATDVRLRPRGETVARRGLLQLVRADRPYAAEWATLGLTLDGWTLPEQPATVRVYAAPGDEGIHRVLVGLSARGATEPRRFSLRSGTRITRGELAPETAKTVGVVACLPAGGVADVLLRVTPAGLVPGLPSGHGAELARRAAGLQLLGIDAVPTDRPCSS